MNTSPLSEPKLNSLGGYPPLYDRPLSPQDWFPNYIATYLERHARQLLAVRDLSLFQRFVRLCAETAECLGAGQ
jgi:predicted AAA+ superfamily ATPase